MIGGKILLTGRESIRSWEEGELCQLSLAAFHVDALYRIVNKVYLQ